jgi:prolyl oligopeptidase
MPEPINDDPYLWLEDVNGGDAMAWVRDQNAEALAALTDDPRFEGLRSESRQVLDSEDRMPLTTWHGEHVYNLWQDAAHLRGLWRRTTLDEYRKEQPDWQVLLDVDALAAQEGESWVWKGATMLRPGYQRCVIGLSRGGSDASVVREFDLGRREFVAGGFALAEAKSDVAWIDADRIYVGTDFGPGSLTTSGYPRILKEWRRGTPLSEAATVYECQPDDLGVDVKHDPTPGFTRDFVYRVIDFFHSEKFLRTPDGELVPIDVPDDAMINAHREWLLVRLRSPWAAGEATHPAGALLAARFDAFLAGDRTMTVLFEPDARTALSTHTWTRNHLILTVLSDVRSRLEILTPAENAAENADENTGWRRLPAVEPSEFAHIDAVDTDPDHSDEYMVYSSGFTQPTTLRYGPVGGEVETLKEDPTFFDTTGMSVQQFFATSADGTRVPYFVVGHPGAGPRPTLLTGYGGFAVPYPPSYDGLVGRGWLARGGTYVVANIRGGGEYGPQWHQAAMRENRPRAYEDFAAVAGALVDRGITTRAQLGIEGGSNGGLLMGVMLTRYPHLFGAIVCRVPLLDMQRYHLLLAGASWMAEYGDPGDESDWAYLRQYSPYQNVTAGQPYPPILLITSTRDDRVHPGHARKMAARLREHGYDVTYYENLEGGHGAAADNEQRAFHWALILEFLWRRLDR